MNWKFWTWPAQIRQEQTDVKALREALFHEERLNERLAKAQEQPVRFVLHGYTEAQMRNAFLTSPDSDLYKGTLEQCDLNLMEAVNDLVNESEQLTDGQLRQRVGQLRGITELREQFEARQRQARIDQQAMQEAKEEHEG